ncbi:hypothetical protein PoB_000155100 [Plakobranchus ocellatus]|uniref:Uncharacterized protein n=1 Tax=Plakobranchus ocellatus TaxID=259542 RepID=A0AAV3XW61_9GAST|nr:hypothetical protein PoB_000155100 [Plakobranchus ocellatus]
MNGGRVLVKNRHSVTMATQTLNSSRTSLHSDMSVEDVADDVLTDLNEEGDNDVFDEATHDERGGLTPAPPPVGEILDDECEDSHPSIGDDKTADLSSQKARTSSDGGMDNLGFMPDTSDPLKEQSTPSNATNKAEMFKATEHKASALKSSAKSESSNKKVKSVAFRQIPTTDNSTPTSEGDGKESRAMKPSRLPLSPISGEENPTGDAGQNHVKFHNTKAETQEEIPSPRNAFLLRPDTPYQPKPKPRHTTPIKALPLGFATSTDIVPSSEDKKLQNKTPEKPTIPWIGQANPGNTRNSDQINDKIAKRQRKIGLLLKDLVLSSSIIPKGKPTFMENNSFDDDEIEDRLGAKNTMFATSNFKLGAVREGSAPEKVTHTPVKGWNSETDKIFPYTSDLLSFPAVSDAANGERLERYGAHIKKKKGKLKQMDGDDDDTMLFKPRHNLLNLDAFGPDRNCFSDQDVNDSDITDLETEPEGAISDTEGITSSRLIPVTKTHRTISIDATNSHPGTSSASGLASTTTSDIDTDLEITDCEVEEEALAQKLRGPRILPGAQAAHELNASRSASAKSRDYIPPSAQARRRGGSQNDSRRRYLALNSLRRKAYELKQVSRTKTSPKPKHKAELMSYNTRKIAQVTMMSQV